MGPKFIMSLCCLLIGACSSLPSLKVQAPIDLRCDASKIEYRSVGNYVEKVTGCGQDNIYYYAHREKKWISPLDRAAFDFSCPKEQLRPRHLSGVNIGIEGCGKRAVYVLANGSWVMNTSTEERDPKDRQGVPALSEI